MELGKSDGRLGKRERRPFGIVSDCPAHGMDINHPTNLAADASPARRANSLRYSAKSATLTIFRAYLLQKRMRSGRQAMAPSSFAISQITPDGFNPARRARWTA